ncbi:MAG: helix-turn-helix transcriptional regulator [Eubacterium sp.]|jgi:transcriptional regulator with XRE-family HTH domain|nr:helix-turn-helix transcriptional regulator [Eubacterium sp.]
MKILIWEMRTERKITLGKLAKESGISKSSIQRMESGIVSPTMDKMEKLAKAMRVKITELFESDYK